MNLNAELILNEIEELSLKQKTKIVREKIQKIRKLINQKLVKPSEGCDCVKTIVRKILKLNLGEKKIETALEICQEVLEFVEDESVRTTKFLCLKELGMASLSEEYLEECIEVYPNNTVFLKHINSLKNENAIEKESLLGSEEIRENKHRKTMKETANFASNKGSLNSGQFSSGPFQNPSVFGQTNERANSGLNGSPSLNVSQDHLTMMEKMDDRQLEMMFSMAKNTQMKEQFKQMHGRELSDDEIRKMETMMNPQSFKMAMGMLKSNPNLLNQMTQQMSNRTQVNSGQGVAPTTIEQNTNLARPTQEQPPVFPTQFTPNNDNMMPKFDENMLMQNKDSLKMIFKMVKENPRMIVEMLAASAPQSPLSGIRNWSDRKLKIVSNFIYYSFLICLETYIFIKKYKGQLLLLIIALFVYKFIL